MGPNGDQFCGYVNGAELRVLLLSNSWSMRVRFYVSGVKTYEADDRNPSYTGEIQHVATFDSSLGVDIRAQVDAMVHGTRVLNCDVEAGVLDVCQNATVSQFNTDLRAQKIAEFVQENGGTMPTEYNPPVQNGLVAYWPLTAVPWMCRPTA